MFLHTTQSPRWARALRTMGAAAGAALVGTLTAALLATPAYADTTAAVDYVALGDSYVSGTGTRDYYPDSGDCLRGPQAYPALWASSHAVTSFQFVACSGAATADVLSSQVSALSAATDLVTIAIGGNDIGFADVITTCQLGGDSTCEAAVNQARTEARTILPGRLDQTYATIRSRAPNARVIVLGYPRLFEYGTCNFPGMSQYERQLLNAGADELSTVIGGRAAAASFTYIDTRPAFAGHGTCGSSPWINGVSWPVVESYHPNDAGHVSGYLPALNAVTG